MIQAIVLLVLGILLVVAAVLLRKKLSRSWMLSLVVAGALVALCGGFFTTRQVLQRQQNRQAAYLGLAYLSQRQTDSAAFYLKKAGGEQDYVAALSRCLLEKLRENDLSARLQLDVAEGLAKSQAQKNLLDILRGLDPASDEQLALVTAQLQDMLRLSEKRQQALDVRLQVENGQYLDEETAAAAGLDDTAASRLQISVLLNNENFEAAVSAAVDLTDRHPSVENRLLLAETVAESAYRGAVLPDTVFAGAGAQESADPSAEKERARLKKRQEKLQTELLALDMTASGSDKDPQKTEERRLQLEEEMQALQNQTDKLYVYRAFNAIADIHTLEARLVRARLHFSLQDYEQAVDTLLGVAGSLQGHLTTDRTVADSLRVVEQVYDKEQDAFCETPEFREAMVSLLAAPFPDLLHVCQSELTQDFAQRVVSDQKEYGSALGISGFDASDFPAVTVTVSGREELLRAIAEGTTVSVRDTHQDVEYTAALQLGVAMDVCVVVDQSGSMGGAPMDNLKAALTEFVRTTGESMSVAIVGFEDSSRCLAALNADRVELLHTINELNAIGGTNITAGIEGGIAALQSAKNTRIMLLMTDGQSSVDFGAVEEAAEQGITIHTIGFGDVNDNLLGEIAERTGGQYIKADASAELSNIYGSLQQFIGNQLVLTYTAPAADGPRYFYLGLEDVSVRRDYDTGAWAQSPPVVYTCSPALLPPPDPDAPGGEVTLTLQGAGLGEVESVTVGDKTAAIAERAEDRLQLTVDAGLATGWQTVTLQTADGTSCSFDRLLAVGESLYYRDLRLGSLRISYAEGIQMGDTLVLAGNIGLQLATQERSSLQLTANGVLLLPWNQPPPAEGEPALTAALDLGDNGTITGWGQVLLESGDGAFSDGAPRVVAEGELEFACGLDQSRLIWRQEEAS